MASQFAPADIARSVRAVVDSAAEARQTVDVAAVTDRLLIEFGEKLDRKSVYELVVSECITHAGLACMLGKS